ncbi:hypothetical protein [Microbacterium sp. No. 7]|uniref:hypothetical protein n=1 Tax=Microbacterium sp. No. 7 TaxID=1714373 RepID=UPI0006D24694|nr:hypothetical protein [Microbacterium sp. No. 7]ALJ20320.1 hypothetical protein AOA12_10515 [Microbacterium sp. No. 7]
MAGYSIGINSETKAFKQGIDSGVIKPLEDAQRELVELGRARGLDDLDRSADKAADALGDLADQAGDAQKASDRLADSLQDAAKETGDLGKSNGPEQLEKALKDAQDETERLADDTRRTADAIEREYRQAYREAGDAGRDGFGKVKEGAQELQQEIGQNLGEAVSSFSGDMSDLAQVGQDTLGGLAATMAGAGPAGMVGAAGLAAAAIGWGGVVGALDEAKQKQEELEQAAADWAGAYESSAGRIIDSAHIVAEVQAIATDPERYKTAAENATAWGVDVSTAMLAMAGDVTAYGTAQESATKRVEEWARVTGDAEKGPLEDYTRAVQELTGEMGASEAQVIAGKEALERQSEAMAMGQEQALNAAKALYDFATANGVATGETDTLGNAVLRLPDGKEIVINAETQTAYQDIETFERRQVAEKTVRVRVDSSDYDRWQPEPKYTTVHVTHGGRTLP